MNGMTFYQGVPTGTIINGVSDIKVVRIPDHACFCDECKMLDEIDVPIIALCKRYLRMEISYEDFRLEHVKLNSVRTSLHAAFDRHFDSGAVSLSQALESIFTVFSEADEVTLQSVAAGALGSMTEGEFRCAVDGLVYGYEIRMRTVHQWKATRTEENTL